MRTLAIRVTALVLVAVLVLAVAVVALGSTPIPAHRGLPDSPCPPGVSIGPQVFCYATAVPVLGAPAPSDFPIPPEGTSPAP
jgi:hypothetical protein